MNKIAVVGIILAFFLFTWCTTKTDPLVSDAAVKEHLPINYTWTYTSVWVWPHITKDLNVWEKTLVLKWWSKDVMIHLYIPKEVYSKFFSSETEYLPWNKIDIVGSVVELPWNLWNRFFEVKEAESMKLVSYPDIEEIEDILVSYWSCQTDSDCEIIWGICPLDCYVWINRGFKDTAYEIIWNYANIKWDIQCSINCPYTNDVKCRFNTCMVNYPTENEVPYYEWPIEERIALYCPDDLVDCDPDWWVVCWSDWINYESNCEACKAWVWTYAFWECLK